MKFDDVLVHLGEFGWYQKRLYFLVCIPSMLSALQSLSVIFQLDIPSHRCSLGPNDTYQVQDAHHSYLFNMSIPWEADRDKQVLSSCQIYQHPQNGSHSNNSTTPCSSWVFDRSTYESTLTEEFNIVCEDRALRSHTNMAGFAGQLVGAFLMGLLSDIFGRRPLFLFNLIMEAVLGIGTAFAPNVYAFMVFRALGNMCRIASFTCAFVLAMELTGPSKRVFVGIVIEIYWCMGLFTLGLIAYFVRHWQTLQLIAAAPTTLYFLFYWIVPESPRWLISRGRIPEAQAIIQKVASVNGVKLPEGVLEKVTVDDQEKSVRVTQMFTTPYLLFITLIIFYNWFVASVVYYGLGLNVQNLSGDIYVNFTIANIVELASYIMCVTLLNRLGRKFLQCGCMLLGGIACVTTMFPVIYGNSSLDWVTVALSMVGKFGASGAFAIVFVYTAELFPTVVRNSGVGVSSFFARIGGMVSPYIADLGVLVGGDLKVALPLIVFGGLSIVAGLLTLFLPETLKRRLPETIEDAKNMRNSSRKANYPMGQTSQQSDISSVKLENFKSTALNKF
ncbi:organic cation transporter protein-like [Haliotis rufescens]|uniref:organic cation transporter protein-like n=1 Tax=Haliotis rufescens TaxID=6454 RepID=UPI00201F6CD2|nr:organic cation transporter protein-like [Haliotis rufescens]